MIITNVMAFSMTAFLTYSVCSIILLLLRFLASTSLQSFAASVRALAQTNQWNPFAPSLSSKVLMMLVAVVTALQQLLQISMIKEHWFWRNIALFNRHCTVQFFQLRPHCRAQSSASCDPYKTHRRTSYNFKEARLRSFGMLEVAVVNFWVAASLFEKRRHPSVSCRHCKFDLHSSKFHNANSHTMQCERLSTECQTLDTRNSSWKNA